MAYAYISGSITHMPKEWWGIYEKIADVVRGFGIDAYIPHIQSPKNAKVTMDEIRNSKNDTDVFHGDIFHNDTSHVERSSLVIAEVSNPSIGVGIEIGIAFKSGKPVIFLAQKNAKVTPLAIGATQAGLAHMVRYETEEGALDGLKNLLEKEFNHLVTA